MKSFVFLTDGIESGLEVFSGSEVITSEYYKHKVQHN